MTQMKKMMTNGNSEQILENLTIGIQMIGNDGILQYFNSAATHTALKFYGEAAGVQSGTSITAATDQEQKEWQRAFQTTLQTGTPVTIVEEQMDDQHGTVWIEHRFNRSEHGVLVISADITKQKRAELALERSEGRFDVAFHSSPVGIAISLYENGTFIEVNDEACRIYGYTREEIIGRTSVELQIIDGETRKKLLAEIRSKERLRAFELPMRSKSGEVRTVLFSWDAIEFDDKSCVIATIIDISEQKRLEEQNRRLQRMENIGALAGGIVHDLNNVLGPIMLVLGTLQRKLTNSEDRETIALLQRKSKQAAELVRQILTFARGSQTKRAPVLLNRIADEVMSMITTTFPANITIEKRFSSDLHHIAADATQIIQVMMNLVVNARDAMPNGGTISIEGENLSVDPVLSRTSAGVKPGDYVILKITDTGEGMSKEIKERIFNPFFTTKETGKGTGLGLSTVASIVKAHHGELQVKSEPGRGTEFLIYFPAELGSGTESRVLPIDVPPMGKGELILFVDDDAIVREVVKIALEAGGYRVLCAADGSEAIAIYVKDREEIAAVVTDMDLPQMDGIMLTGVLKKMNPNIRVIGSSGTPDHGRLQRFNESGIKEFLPKPYTSETLLRVIHTVLTLPETEN